MSKKNVEKTNATSETSMSDADKKDKRFNIIIFISILVLGIGLLVFYFVYFGNEANNSKDNKAAFHNFDEVASWYDFTDLYCESNMAGDIQYDYAQNYGAPECTADNIRFIIFNKSSDAKKYFRHRKDIANVKKSNDNYFEGYLNDNTEEKIIFVMKDNVLIYASEFSITSNSDKFTYDEVRDLIYDDFVNSDNN